MEEIKQVIIVRKDIEMSTGKLVAQACHASLSSYLDAVEKDEKVASAWLREGEKKIVLKTNDLETLVKLFNAFKYKNIPCALVSDAGLTEVPPGTKTALGVGPWKGTEIDAFTRVLKLL